MSPPRSTPPVPDGSAEPEDLLAHLPVHDVAPELAERVRQRAHGVLRRAHLRRRQASGPSWVRSYHRFVEPAVLIGLGLWQLAWTVQDTVALFLR